MWKELTFLDKKYKNHFISDKGEAKKIYKNGVVYFYKPRYNQDGYSRVCLKGKDFPTHRLVAMAFIPNPEEKETVNHIDMNKKNNKVENLEWATRKEQVNNDEYKSIRGKRINAYSKDGKLVYSFVSVKEAHRNGFDSRAISNIAKNKKLIDGKGYEYTPKTHKGYIWKFAECND